MLLFFIDHKVNEVGFLNLNTDFVSTNYQDEGLSTKFVAAYTQWLTSIKIINVPSDPQNIMQEFEQENLSIDYEIIEIQHLEQENSFNDIPIIESNFENDVQIVEQDSQNLEKENEHMAMETSQGDMGNQMEEEVIGEEVDLNECDASVIASIIHKQMACISGRKDLFVPSMDVFIKFFILVFGNKKYGKM